MSGFIFPCRTQDVPQPEDDWSSLKEHVATLSSRVKEYRKEQGSLEAERAALLEKNSSLRGEMFAMRRSKKPPYVSSADRADGSSVTPPAYDIAFPSQAQATVGASSSIEDVGRLPTSSSQSSVNSSSLEAGAPNLQDISLQTLQPGVRSASSCATDNDSTTTSAPQALSNLLSTVATSEVSDSECEELAANFVRFYIS